MPDPNVRSRKKLIEVALPLEAINASSAREKSIRHGHPSTLHLWWARRPLAAARAVIFGQMVDDPSSYVDTLLGVSETRRFAERELKKRRELWVRRKKESADGSPDAAEPGPEPTLEDCAADIERQRLFRIVEDLVKWESTTDQQVLQKARDEIWQSWRRACADNAGHPRAKELFDRGRLPAFHDPFAGGGALPLEAQRLGLEAYASDLNPVAVLINKAMIEIPPKFAGQAPVNPEARTGSELVNREWTYGHGIADDVRFYGQWVSNEARKRNGHLYPKVSITAETARDRPDLKPYVGKDLTVVAWLWARTVRSPNPAFADVHVPLVTTFMLSSKAGKEAWLNPIVEKGNYRFTVRIGKPKSAENVKNGTKLARGANFRCLMSGTPISGEYIKSEGRAGRLRARLLAIVAEGDRGRIYLTPTQAHEAVAEQAKPEWTPDVPISGSTQYLGVKPYGMEHFDQIFTHRQMATLATFSDLVSEAIPRIHQHAVEAGLSKDSKRLSEGGVGATAYAEAVSVYLALAVDKAADYNTTLVAWSPTRDQAKSTFARQAFPMVWDFTEVNPFARAAGDFLVSLEGSIRFLSAQLVRSKGFATQADAASQDISSDKIVSTDPPYYDNVPYADLSDFFYVWLRRSLRQVFPDLFATVAVPKAEELVAFAYRHKEGKEGAERFFLQGMSHAMHRLAEQAHPGFPVTCYYAFKQSENEGDGGIASTGWETFLDALIHAGFAIGGTWPIRTEREARSRGIESNALASSIVLVCRKRSIDAPAATRREFVAALKAELPLALSQLQRGNIAPVDLAQAAIGPGMSVYTRYANVLDADGKKVSVREALALINQMLDEALAEQEGDFDAVSRWALAWFEQNGFNEGEYGIAEVLSKAKVTSIAGMAEARILESRRGKVRLLRPDEFSDDWDPSGETNLSAWEIVHHLVRALAGGESAAAALAAKLGSKAEIARELAYRLYNTSSNKKRAAEALAYNGLVQSWAEIMRLARETASANGASQTELLV